MSRCFFLQTAVRVYHHSNPMTSGALLRSRDMSTENKHPAATTHQKPNPTNDTFRKQMISTTETVVSKLIPAGMGWQAASLYAEQIGCDSKSIGFSLCTGLGDASAVFAGHMLYTMFKIMLSRASNQILGTNYVLPKLKKELSIGGWLASSASASGAAWQPLVNHFNDLDCQFLTNATGTGAICAFIFFAGLRAWRPRFGLPKNKDTLLDDVRLSIAIGGATGTFVATDLSIPGNMLASTLGILPNDPASIGLVKAGAATGFGFFSVATLRDGLTTARESLNSNSKIGLTK